MKSMRYTEKKAVSRQEYLWLFDKTKESAREALREAHEIRRFEIGLYWRRANYFWLFVAAAFTGFFVVAAARGMDIEERAEAKFFIACLGLLFSLGWYLVNRGSKFWQEVWEKHIDLLEDQVYGPLQKTFLEPEPWPVLSPLGAARFSVSRVNLVLNICMIVAWIWLAVRSASAIRGWGEPCEGFNFKALSLLTLLGAFLLWWLTGPRANPRRCRRLGAQEFSLTTKTVEDVQADE